MSLRVCRVMNALDVTPPASDSFADGKAFLDETEGRYADLTQDRAQLVVGARDQGALAAEVAREALRYVGLSTDQLTRRYGSDDVQYRRGLVMACVWFLTSLDVEGVADMFNQFAPTVLTTLTYVATERLDDALDLAERVCADLDARWEGR